MAALTQKSQVTVPKKIRMALGLGPGDEVEFQIDGSRAILLKKPKSLPFGKWKGYLGKARTNKLMEQIR